MWLYEWWCGYEMKRNGRDGTLNMSFLARISFGATSDCPCLPFVTDCFSMLLTRGLSHRVFVVLVLVLGRYINPPSICLLVFSPLSKTEVFVFLPKSRNYQIMFCVPFAVGFSPKHDKNIPCLCLFCFFCFVPKRSTNPRMSCFVRCGAMRYGALSTMQD